MYESLKFQLPSIQEQNRVKSALKKESGARSVTRTRDLQISQEINDASYKSPYESGAPTD